MTSPQDRATQLKEIGYLASGVSVLLLGLAAWHTASGQILLQIAIAGGIALAVIGMILRWRAHLVARRANRETPATKN